MDKKKISLGFTNKQFQEGVHICLLYRDEAERREVISKFLESGINNREKVEYFTDIMSPDELRTWLKELGISCDKGNCNEQVSISIAKDTYCPTGKFVPEDMIQVLCNCYDHAINDGYNGVRVTGETAWTNQQIPGIENFITYEAMINQAIEKHPIAVMCQYDVSKFDGGTIFDILQVHPLMVVHGQIVLNPAYVKPNVFLKELAGRK